MNSPNKKSGFFLISLFKSKPPNKKNDITDYRFINLKIKGALIHDKKYRVCAKKCVKNRSAILKIRCTHLKKKKK